MRLAGCDYASVEQVNRDTLNPLLKALTGTAFMRYFKTTLYCDCPLWPDDGMCAMRDCSVCECEDDEVPKPWKLAERGHVKVACQASGALEVVSPLVRPKVTSLTGAATMKQTSERMA